MRPFATRVGLASQKDISTRRALHTSTPCHASSMPSSPMYNEIHMHTPAALTVSVDSLCGQMRVPSAFTVTLRRSAACIQASSPLSRSCLATVGPLCNTQNSRQDALALLIGIRSCRPSWQHAASFEASRSSAWNRTCSSPSIRSSSTYTTGNAPWPPQMYRPRHKSRPSLLPHGCPSPPSSHADRRTTRPPPVGRTRSNRAAARGSATFKSADSPAWTAC